jgi:hypothetical protein
MREHVKVREFAKDVKHLCYNQHYIFSLVIINGLRRGYAPLRNSKIYKGGASQCHFSFFRLLSLLHFNIEYAVYD